jgi:hypothetical protein
MRDGDDFTADVVVQSVDGIGVDETIAGPQASFYAFLNFTENLKNKLHRCVNCYYVTTLLGMT